MKKRTYRAVKINGVVREKLAEAVAGQRVVFGVDVAKVTCLAQAMVPTMAGPERVMQAISFEQSQNEAFVSLLQGLPATVEVALEPTGTYGDALRWQLEQAGIAVYRVGAKRSHDAAEVFDGVPSMHDAKAADVVARLHLQGASRRWEMKTEEQRQLSAEVKRMSFYDERRLKALQLLESLLARHWPELTEVLELTSATLAALLSRYGSAAAVSADSEGARELMREASHGRLSGESIDAVVEGARTTRGMPPIAAETALLMELAREAQLARQQTEQAKKPVVARVAHDEGAKHMARVVGHVTAGVLLDAGGDPRRYAGARQYMKALGLNLKVRQSGESQGQLKLTKRGPARARRYLYYAVLRLVQADGVVRAWYRKKVARDGERYRGRAVVAVMRKLAAALFHVARGELFDSSKLFDTSKLTSLLAVG